MNTTARAGRIAGTPQALLLIVANVLPTMGIVSLIPIVPQLFAQFHDAPHAAFLVPAIITAPSICIAALSLVAGWIADRIGRRKLFLMALLAYAFIGCAPLFLNDLKTIIATRVCLGVAEAVILTCVATLMGDYFKGATRQKWLAWQNAAGSLMATGLIIVGGILGTLSWHGPFAMYALAIPIFLAAVRLTWEPEPVAEEVKVGIQKAANAPFPVAAMLLVYSVSFFGAIIFFVEVLQLGVVMNAIGKASPEVIGFVTAGTGFALPLGAYLLSRLKTLRVGYVLAFALAFFMTSFFLLARSKTLLGVIWGACLAQFACGITFPLLITWAQSKLHFGVRAFGMGLWTSCFFIGQFASTMLMSYLSQTAGGIAGAMNWLAIVCAIALPVSVLGEAITGRPVAATHPNEGGQPHV
jgi:MFS family permease